MAIKALYRAGRYTELIELTEDMPEQFKLNIEYDAIKAWTLYRLGRVMEAHNRA